MDLVFTFPIGTFPTALLLVYILKPEVKAAFGHGPPVPPPFFGMAPLYVPDPWHCRESMLYLDGREIKIEPEDSYRLELENVGAAIRGEGEPLLGREDALGQARTIDALYRAAETGVSVSP